MIYGNLKRLFFSFLIDSFENIQICNRNHKIKASMHIQISRRVFFVIARFPSLSFLKWVIGPSASFDTQERQRSSSTYVLWVE